MSKKKKPHTEEHSTDAATTVEESTTTVAEETPENIEVQSETEPSESDESETTPEDSEAQEEQTPEQLIEELNGRLKEANDRYLRLMAEFDNYKKRTGREYERMVESANEKLMLELIDVRETFERALKHGETGTEYRQLFDGVKLIFTKFDGVLSTNGLAPFAEPGDEFDPQIHDALMKSPHNEIPEDHIADIYEKGYRLKERVIKHARVIVSAGKVETNEEDDKKSE